MANKIEEWVKFKPDFGKRYLKAFNCSQNRFYRVIGEIDGVGDYKGTVVIENDKGLRIPISERC